MHSEDFIKKILDDIDTFNIDDIPNIDLYMDQVSLSSSCLLVLARR